jgi:hypothetical protein
MVTGPLLSSAMMNAPCLFCGLKCMVEKDCVAHLDLFKAATKTASMVRGLQAYKFKFTSGNVSDPLPEWEL